MARLRLKFLGTFEAQLDGQPLRAFQSNKVRALLAYLAVESDRAHSRNTLTGLFWPEKPERRARASLSQAIYNLRKLLEEPTGENLSPQIYPGATPFLLVERETLQLNPQADIWVDVHAFDQLIRDCKLHTHSGSSDCEDCRLHLDEAIGLYHGKFLKDLHPKDSAVLEEWMRVEGERLEQMALQALHKLAECHLQRGAFDSAQNLARRQIEIDPFQEAAHRQLIRLLALDGQRNAAMAHFEKCRQLLELELGVPPTRETVALFERVRDEEGLAPESSAPLHNLPAFLVPLVGRKKELTEMRTQLLDPYCRLLAVVGQGGSGKTRLAIDVARSLVGRFVHGIYFLPLSAVASVDELISNLTKILGLTIQEKRPVRDQLFDYLRQKDMLLLMDSFEGIMEGTELVAEILQTAPALKILATSRLRLNIQDEYLFPLEGLEYARAEGIEESDQSEAIQLFLAGARRVQSTFELNADNQDDIATICQLVQGMPLAILLADAWVETLSPSEILEEIRASYTFLEADWADIPPRQRSLRATFDYSWNLLSAREQTLFQILCIFQGGFTRQAAENVARASIQELRMLIGKSFLGYSPSGRYSMHDMLRQYGTEKLASSLEYTAYHTLHSDYYLKLIAAMESDLKGTRQQAALNELHLELANLRAAWDWAVEQGNVESIGHSIESLGLLCEMRFLYQEGERACRLAAEMVAARELSADQIIILVRLELWQARFDRLLGNPDLSIKLHQDCMSRLDGFIADTAEGQMAKAFLLLEMANAVLYTDLNAAHCRYLESLELYRSVEDSWGTANALNGLGEAAVLSGRFTDSITFYKESLALFRALGDPRGIAGALTGLGGGLFRIGQLQEGEDCIRETIQIFKELEDHPGMVRSQFNLARAFFFQGRYLEVIELYDKCTPILKDLGLQYDYAHILALAILAHGQLGMYEKTRVQVQELLLLCQEIEYPRFFSVVYSGSGFIAIAQGEFCKACDYFHKFVDIQKEIGNPDEQASGAGVLGGAYLKSGNLQLARQHLYEALQVSVEIKAIWSASWTLPWVALYLIRRGYIERGVEVFALSSKLPIVANSKWIAEVVERDIIAVSENLPPEVVEAARERGKKADLFATCAELLEELNE